MHVSPFAEASPAPEIWFARWDQSRRSTQGRPVETMQIGRGEFRTLVLGSLHGGESMAVAIADRLALHLGKQSDHWHEVNVLVVKTPNPDGYATGSNANARGVDLNRNFPQAAGRQPQDNAVETAAWSEVESRIVRQLIESYRPHRIVHVKSTRNQTGWVLCNRPAAAAAAYLKQFSHLHVGRLEDHALPGSLERYASDALGIETLTFALPQPADERHTWADYQAPLLAAAAYVDPAWRSTPAAGQSAVAASRDRLDTAFPGSSRSPFGNWQSTQEPERSRTRRDERKSSWPFIQLWPPDNR
jgi:hypothetical protein